MEPNDQSLCIVPNLAAAGKEMAPVLPSEGDSLLAAILSKAFLLAEDVKIEDATITRQIRAGAP